MHSKTVWKLADRPNYITNTDKQFPYSGLPYIGEYDLLKIPVSLDDNISHVDYWGEGKVVTDEGIRGFSNCYNVNHQYKLVGSGPDLDRKIPNRIPVVSYNDCDTSCYIKSNSVLLVTVAGGLGYITSSCAKDIARIVNKDHGKVVLFGVEPHSKETLGLTDELSKIGFPPSWNATLPRELHGVTYYNSHVCFLDTRVLKDELYNKIANGEYDAAVLIAKNSEAVSGNDINEIVTRFISSAPGKVMSFAYKLWHGDAKGIVRNHFPRSFQHIVGEDAVTIVNQQYRQPLKLDVHTDYYNDRLAWGDNSRDLTSQRVAWRLLPVWTSSSLTFKLYNIDCNMYLKLDVNVDNIGDRKAWGSPNSNEERHRYYLNPEVINGTLVFYIVNYEYGQGLKLGVDTDSYGDRLLWGHNGNLHDDGARIRWLIAAW